MNSPTTTQNSLDVTSAWESALHHLNAGDWSTCVELCQQIVSVAPQHAMALNVVAIDAYHRQNYAVALAYVQRGLAQGPGLLDLHNTLGAILMATADLDGARRAYEDALLINPQDVAARYNLANIFYQLGEADTAEQHYRAALATDSTHIHALLNLGTLLHSQKKDRAAIELFDRACQLQPRNPACWYNLGNSHHALGHRDKAADCYTRTLELDPQHVDARYNIAVHHQRAGRLDQAIMLYQSLTSDPDCPPDAHWNLARCLLTLGNLEMGWQEFAYRALCFPLDGRLHPQPRWQGQSLHDKTILVSGEQGVGDEIIFSSMLSDLAARAKHVIFECEPRLASLFTRSFPTIEVLANQTPPLERCLSTDIDFHVRCGDLCRWLRRDLADFSTDSKYLLAEPQRVEAWRRRLAQLGPQKKIGISWRSKLRTPVRDEHYTRIEQWAPILKHRGVTFINLQYDDCKEELERAQALFGCAIVNYSDLEQMGDFDDTAALISALDLVISPATTPAILAAALGINVWQLTLRWENWEVLGTETFPWFPKMRLFFADQSTDWDNTLSVVGNQLINCYDNRAASAVLTEHV